MASRLESIPSTDVSGVKRRTYHLGNGQEVHVYDCRALRFTAPATVPKRTTKPLPLKLKVEHIS
jgi:hypothetical protein